MDYLIVEERQGIVGDFRDYKGDADNDQKLGVDET